MLLPRQKTPNLELETLNHRSLNLPTDIGERGVDICYNRGLYCPICAKQPMDLQSHVDNYLV